MHIVFSFVSSSIFRITNLYMYFEDNKPLFEYCLGIDELINRNRRSGHA